MHPTTFEYLRPTEGQMASMERLRAAAKVYAGVLEAELPEGPDKTHVLRLFRGVAMWGNVCVTRHGDGAPRAV